MKIFVINLKRRPDRKVRMASQLRRLGLIPIWIDGVDGCSGTPMPRGTLVNCGHYGCFMSHVRVLNAFLDGTESYAMVMEDDAVLSPSLDWKLFLADLPDLMSREALDFLQLGFITHLSKRTLRWRVRDLLVGHRDKGKVLSETLGFRYHCGLARPGTHAYVISRDFASKVRFLNQPVWVGADGFYERLATASKAHGYLTMGCLTRSLAEQESRTGMSWSTDSDIEGSAAE